MELYSLRLFADSPTCVLGSKLADVLGQTSYRRIEGRIEWEQEGWFVANPAFFAKMRSAAMVRLILLFELVPSDFAIECRTFNAKRFCRSTFVPAEVF